MVGVVLVLLLVWFWCGFSLILVLVGFWFGFSLVLVWFWCGFTLALVLALFLVMVHGGLNDLRFTVWGSGRFGILVLVHGGLGFTGVHGGSLASLHDRGFTVIWTRQCGILHDARHHVVFYAFVFMKPQLPMANERTKMTTKLFETPQRLSINQLNPDNFL